MDCNRVYARIDLDAIRNNILCVRERLKPETKLMLVVKADAYGHGAAVLAQEFENETDFFAVAAIDEALELRTAGIRTPILILGYTSPRFYPEALEHHIALTIFSREQAQILSQMAVARGKTADVHLALDTGMGRIGWSIDEASADEAASVCRLPNLAVGGIFSHFARADEADKAFAGEQRAKFDRFCEMLTARGVDLPPRHLNNSAGILDFQEQYEMVREGIILYGLYPSEEVSHTLPIRPAMELISSVSHVKTVDAGCGISYGSDYVTTRKTRIATVPIGYADGYPRALSGCGEVLIHGHRCPILGRICMDQMMVDVSDVPDVQVEDDVVLIGRDGAEMIPVEELAKRSGVFHYELICGISRRVPRVYTKGGTVCRRTSYMEK